MQGLTYLCPSLHPMFLLYIPCLWVLNLFPVCAWQVQVVLFLLYVLKLLIYRISTPLHWSISVLLKSGENKHWERHPFVKNFLFYKFRYWPAKCRQLYCINYSLFFTQSISNNDVSSLRNDRTNILNHIINDRMISTDFAMTAEKHSISQHQWHNNINSLCNDSTNILYHKINDCGDLINKTLVLMGSENFRLFWYSNKNKKYTYIKPRGFHTQWKHWIQPAPYFGGEPHNILYHDEVVQVTCEDIIMPTITPNRPNALPKISITNIFTKSVEFWASERAQLLPIIPTHILI